MPTAQEVSSENQDQYCSRRVATGQPGTSSDSGKVDSPSPSVKELIVRSSRNTVGGVRPGDHGYRLAWLAWLAGSWSSYTFPGIVWGMPIDER